MPDGIMLARDPICGTSLPDSDCRCTVGPTTMGALAPLALPNILGENPLRTVNTLQNCPGNSQSVFQFSSLRRKMKVMKQSIDITDKGLWFDHIGLF